MRFDAHLPLRLCRHYTFDFNGLRPPFAPAAFSLAELDDGRDAGVVLGTLIGLGVACPRRSDDGDRQRYSARTRDPQVRVPGHARIAAIIKFRQAERCGANGGRRPLKSKGIMSAQTERQMGVESHYSSKKDRVFVRGITGHYKLKDELARLRAMPRVRKGSEIKFVDGPQAYSRHYVEPHDGLTQTLHIHLEEYGPGGKSQKHGHVNEAAFYILDGEGYEIHDGVRYDWSAGISRSCTTTACISTSTPIR